VSEIIVYNHEDKLSTTKTNGSHFALEVIKDLDPCMNHTIFVMLKWKLDDRASREDSSKQGNYFPRWNSPTNVTDRMFEAICRKENSVKISMGMIGKNDALFSSCYKHTEICSKAGHQNRCTNNTDTNTMVIAGKVAAIKIVLRGKEYVYKGNMTFPQCEKVSQAEIGFVMLGGVAVCVGMFLTLGLVFVTKNWRAQKRMEKTSRSEDGKERNESIKNDHPDSEVIEEEPLRALAGRTVTKQESGTQDVRTPRLDVGVGPKAISPMPARCLPQHRLLTM
jgi:hypothetical protein